MILVTGASGMLGRAAVSRFLHNEERVRGHVRSSDLELHELFGYDQQAHDLELASADFSSFDLNAAMALCDGCTTVVHSAGLVHQPNAASDLYQQLNFLASKFLSEAARKCGVQQFIFISSSSVYGNRSTNMSAENEPLHADTPYASSKINAENYLKEHPPAPSTVVLRPSLVFGEGDRGNMLSLIRQVLSGKYFIVGDGSARKSLIYSGDLALALELLIKDPPAGFSVFNIANPEPVSIKQLSQEILSAAGKPSGLISMPPWVVNSAAGAANAILGKRSPLSADRLDKLTRENSISVDAFVSKYKFAPQFNLQASLAREINWAHKANLL